MIKKDLLNEKKTVRWWLMGVEFTEPPLVKKANFVAPPPPSIKSKLYFYCQGSFLQRLFKENLQVTLIIIFDQIDCIFYHQIIRLLKGRGYGYGIYKIILEHELLGCKLREHVKKCILSERAEVQPRGPTPTHPPPRRLTSFFLNQSFSFKIL